MTPPTPIPHWLVLGPIFNPAHQTEPHFPDDTHPPAAQIVADIDANPLDPAALTRSLAQAPKADSNSQFKA
jgi:hypothetical protein